MNRLLARLRRPLTRAWLDGYHHGWQAGYRHGLEDERLERQRHPLDRMVDTVARHDLIEQLRKEGRL